MVTGQQLEAQARRFDRALSGIEREAAHRVDDALRRSAIRLEDELRRLYTPALRAGTKEGIAYREARARVLLQQVRSLMRVTDGIPVDDVFGSLIRESYAAGVDGATSVLSLYQQQAIAAHAVVPEYALIAATNAGERLAHRGILFASKAESIIIDGLIRGQGFRRTASELRRETALTTYEAERIIYTESVRAADEGRQQTYEDGGVTHVQVMSTLDDRLCGFCAARSGNVYKIGDVTVGFHPWCRCFLAPWRQEWQDAGLTDDAWFVQHRKASFKRSHEKPRYGITPSEKWAGIEEAPKPVWTPGG